MNEIAVHEAAHAVVALDYGVWFEHVELKDDNGRVFNDPNELDHTTSLPPTDDDLVEIRKRVAVIHAGPLADRRTGAVEYERRLCQHCQQALGVLQLRGVTNAESVVESVWEETELRVTESWPRIMRLADALEAKRFLTHDDVKGLVSRP
jgi:hypothetical protein